MKVVAIIPARGGSKRIPAKNMKEFAGQPMISFPIQAALNTGVFDKIIVSTDSERIAEIASSCGAEAPFVRPSALADDFTATAPVLIHALEWLNEHECLPDYFCCIYPTTPLLEEKYLLKGFDLLRSSRATTAFSVVEFPSPIMRAMHITSDGYLQMLDSKYQGTRTQDLQVTYHDAGQFYWAHTEQFMREQTLFSQKSVPVVLPRLRALDIDTPEDWEIAEKVFQAIYQTGRQGNK